MASDILGDAPSSISNCKTTLGPLVASFHQIDACMQRSAAECDRMPPGAGPAGEQAVQAAKSMGPQWQTLQSRSFDPLIQTIHSNALSLAAFAGTSIAIEEGAGSYVQMSDNSIYFAQERAHALHAALETFHSTVDHVHDLLETAITDVEKTAQDDESQAAKYHARRAQVQKELDNVGNDLGDAFKSFFTSGDPGKIFRREWNQANNDWIQAQDAQGEADTAHAALGALQELLPDVTALQNDLDALLDDWGTLERKLNTVSENLEALAGSPDCQTLEKLFLQSTGAAWADLAHYTTALT